jgi:hypothetical protein
MTVRLLFFLARYLMAHDLHAIADLIGDAFDLADIEVSDLLKASPFISTLPMEPSSNGTTHKYVKETGAPVVGFRSPNAGRDLDSSDDTLVSIDLKVLDFSWLADVAVANAWRKGREDYIAREGMRHLKAALFAFERQVINGIVGASDSAAASGSAAGFAGFRDAGTVNALADAMVVNATGAVADTASSVWAVRIATDGVCGVYKGDSASFELGDTSIVQHVVDPGTDNKTFPAFYTPGVSWLGLQVGSAFDIGRIANLTATTAPLTDDLIAQLLERFPVGFGPTHLLMSRRSRRQLQDSRTATTISGAPAPFPQEAFGVPIVVTDAIGNTEELLA